MVFNFEGRQIKICDNVLEIIMQYLQKEKDAFEAGGIIIGRENISNSNLIMEFATVPMPGDERKRCRYLRKDKQHVLYYESLYKGSSGIYTYIGEWHTHLESVPQYSSVDIKNWKRIGKNAPTNNKQYHLIAGYDAFCIWKYSYRERKARIIATVKWNEVKFNEDIEE
ncbi:Mov34/MPN/PAD-1 family protein [Sedimentibacter sp. zth1]|uniref:Mov34/MPN/PAD-1 family protein n=1 Tax=Sedimentibacter sp. zth1 TaxID=2816908 RepID=UPI001A91ACEF|nr:Mov34/MPN/PAD-1 family protein [Sedimentibacter sp. zth1]QSX05593.1 Mov34/MPN/PAD-1 family protein [Sedimentibacter sp. zth1]